MRCEYCTKKVGIMTLQCKYCALKLCVKCIQTELHACSKIESRIADEKNTLKNKITVEKDKQEWVTRDVTF